MTKMAYFRFAVDCVVHYWNPSFERCLQTNSNVITRCSLSLMVHFAASSYCKSPTISVLVSDRPYRCL